MALIIDPETTVVSPTVLKNPGIRLKERGSLLKVSGTFKDIDDVFLQLLREEGKKSNHGAPKVKSSEYEHALASTKSASSARVEPVEVDSVIMNYIQDKYSKELNKIIRPEVSMQVTKQQVTFHPRDTERGPALAQLTREHFISFYQKIATGLQSRSYVLDATQIKLLFAKFPELQISTGQTGDVTLTGRFFSLDRFEQFLKSPPKRSSPGQINYNVDMSATASSQASPNKTTDKEETCSICFERMVESQMKTLEKCKHSFCKGCLQRAFEIKPVCPTCGIIYGALKGTQPKVGKMNVTYNRHPLPGYENYGTIIIHYSIPDGIQEVSQANYCLLICFYIIQQYYLFRHWLIFFSSSFDSDSSCKVYTVGLHSFWHVIVSVETSNSQGLLWILHLNRINNMEWLIWWSKHLFDIYARSLKCQSFVTVNGNATSCPTRENLCGLSI